MASDNDLVITDRDLLEYAGARVPVALCLDVSYSMEGDPINELNKGVSWLFNSLREHPAASVSAEVAIVAFADKAALILDYQSLERCGTPPKLHVGSKLGYETDLGGGVALTLEVLDTRKQKYQVAGVDYFQPILVLMTDGRPTTKEHLNSAPLARQLEAARKLTTLPIGIGSEADLKTLEMFSAKNQPLRLKGLRFDEFFGWLSRLIVLISQSRPGERIQPDLEGIKGWADFS
jgi:uncharacterized protein YegL